MADEPQELIIELEHFRVALPLEYRKEATVLFDKIIGALKEKLVLETENNNYKNLCQSICDDLAESASEAINLLTGK